MINYSEPFISEPLFTSRSNNSKGKKLTTRSISYIVKQGLKSIGLHDNCYTAHSLRHTTAVSILRAGGSLEKVQFTLRHINPFIILIKLITSSASVKRNSIVYVFFFLIVMELDVTSAFLKTSGYFELA